jgi:hypothetical protein
MNNVKFNVIIWFSLIIIALVVASIDVMMWKINLLNPSNEPVVTNIVYYDVWFKISIVMFLVPALFSYYVNRKLLKSIFIIIAGLMLISFGLEDIFYFAIRGIVTPNEIKSLSEINPALFTKIGFVNLMPNELDWLNNNPLISIFGRPVTPDVLFESTAFALVASLILVLI